MHGRVIGPRWIRLPDGTRFDEAMAGTAWVHADLGLKKYRERDIPGAIAELTLAIGLNPAASDLYSHRGESYVLQGNLDAALADFTRSLELLPDCATYYQRGHVRRLLHDPRGAVADFRAAYSPERYSPAIFWLYLTEWAEGRQQEATAEMVAAVERMMHDPEEQQLGKFLLGQINEAQLLAETGRGRHGDVHLARFYIAMRCQLAGNHTGAMERFRLFLQMPAPALHHNGKVIEIGDGRWFERNEARRALQSDRSPDPSHRADPNASR